MKLVMETHNFKGSVAGYLILRKNQRPKLCVCVCVCKKPKMCV